MQRIKQLDQEHILEGHGGRVKDGQGLTFRGGGRAWKIRMKAAKVKMESARQDFSHEKKIRGRDMG